MGKPEPNRPGHSPPARRTASPPPRPRPPGPDKRARRPGGVPPRARAPPLSPLSAAPPPSLPTLPSSSRPAQYEEGSAPALALKATIERTHNRFAAYGATGLLCGADGLPHLIVDGSLAHLGEFTYPGLAFLYVAGWIGYAGRTFIIANKKTANPVNGEIVLDVPAALNIMFASAGWPVAAFRELQSAWGRGGGGRDSSSLLAAACPFLSSLPCRISSAFVSG